MPDLRSIPTRMCLATFLTATLSVIILLSAATSRAIEPIQGPGGPSASYDFGGENCTGGGSDPVGVVFRGKRASAANVSHSIDIETLRYYSYEGGHGSETQPWIYHENTHRQSLLVHEPDGSYGCENDNASNAEAPEAGPLAATTYDCGSYLPALAEVKSRPLARHTTRSIGTPPNFPPAVVKPALAIMPLTTVASTGQHMKAGSTRLATP